MIVWLSGSRPGTGPPRAAIQVVSDFTLISAATRSAGTPLRASSVDPGFVETEFSEVRFHGDTERAAGVYKGFQPLSADDIADAVAYVANLPPHANILRMVIMPTAQRNVYVVDRT